MSAVGSTYLREIGSEPSASLAERFKRGPRLVSSPRPPASAGTPEDTHQMGAGDVGWLWPLNGPRSLQRACSV